MGHSQSSYATWRADSISERVSLSEADYEALLGLDIRWRESDPSITNIAEIMKHFANPNLVFMFFRDDTRDKPNIIKAYAELCAKAGDMLHISWFVAPGCGNEVLRKLIDEARKHHFRIMDLIVSVSKEEDAKALKARLLLYMRHGFRVCAGSSNPCADAEPVQATLYLQLELWPTIPIAHS